MHKLGKLYAVLAKNPRDLDDKCDLFKKCTAVQYKALALFALRTLCGYENFTRCRTDNAGWDAHHITKAIFEEQEIFDPYSDMDFIKEAADICPWYILRYTEDAVSAADANSSDTGSGVTDNG